MRPFLAYNFGRLVSDVLDSDVRQFLNTLATFKDQRLLYSLDEQLFKEVLVGGNLALRSLEEYDCAAVCCVAHVTCVCGQV